MKKTFFTIALLLSFLSMYAQPEFQHQIIQASTIQQNSHYGRGVCINGDYAIVSALLDNHEGTLTEGGAAFVYHLEDGVWNFQYKLMAEDAQAKDHFGRSVFINDTHAIVGATYSDDPESYNGSAYIFVNNGDGTWSQQAKLLASDRRRMDRFGVTVGISGNYAIVGCYGADYNEGGVDYTNAGAAYVYEFDGTSWGNEVILHSSTPLNEEKFGWCVNIHGTTALIGSYEDRANEADGVPGGAYIFQLVGGVWTETQKLAPADITDGQNFGYSIDLSDNYAIVGSMTDDDEGGDSGSAYIFRNNGGTYDFVQKLTASNGAEGDNFGFSVGIEDNQAIVGAWHTNSGEYGYTNTGSAYIYTRDQNDGTWSESTQLVAGDAGTQDQNGWFVSISGNYALTGATGYDNDRSNLSIDQGTNEGAAYIWASADAGNPAPKLESTAPVSGSSDVSVTQNLTFNFDSNIQFSNTGEILIARTRDNAEYARYAITSSDLTITTNSLEISNLNLEYATNYYVQFINEPITDIEGTAFTGLTQIGDYNFTTENTNPVWATNYPALSNQTKSLITLSGQFEILGDVFNGDYYVTLTSQSGTTQQQIVDGLDNLDQPAVWSTSGNEVSGNLFALNIDISALLSETEYFVNIVAQNAGGFFTPVSTLAFTTFDTEAPTYSATYPSMGNINGTDATMNVSINEDGTTYYMVSLTSAPSPSINDVLNASGENTGNMALTADQLSSINFTGLDFETDYTVYIVSRDLADNYIETSSPTQLQFTTLSMAESIPVATITPEDGSVDVPTSQAITVSFNKAIYNSETGEIYGDGNGNSDVAEIFSLKAINTGYISDPLSPPPPPTVDVPFTVSWEDSEPFTATISPDQTLSENQVYELTVSRVKDIEGASSEVAVSTFTTVDELPPVTYFVNPIVETTDFSITSPLIVMFSEPVWISGPERHIVTNDDLAGLITLTVYDESNPDDLNPVPVPFSAVIDPTGRVLTITPDQRLNVTTAYKLVIGVLEDEIGHLQSSSSELIFSTASANVWTGLGNTSVFTDAANWVDEFNPNAGIIISGGTTINVATIGQNINIKADYLIIEPLGKLTIENGSELTLENELVIESSTDGNGSLINNGTLNVNAEKCVIEQEIPLANSWYNISSPVASINLGDIAGMNGSLIKFDNQTGSYINCAESENLVPMMGYMISGEGTLLFKGQLNQGAQSIMVEYGYNNLGWNLVGNPYPSAIDWNLIAESDKNNIENTYWILLSSNQFGTYNGYSKTGINLPVDSASQIPSNQAFWVKAISTGAFGIDNSAQTHNVQSHFKSAGASEKHLPLIRLTGVNGNVKDETVIAFDNEATVGVDKFDSEKRFGYNINAMELYTINNNSELAINVYNELSNELVVPVGFKVQSEGEYAIELSELANFGDDVEVVLEDTKTGAQKTLKVGDSYVFSTDANKTNDRFIVRLKSVAGTLGVETQTSELVKIYNSQRTVVISKMNYVNNNYRIFNVSGKLITSGSLEGSETRVDMEKEGVYVVVVYGDNLKTTQKIVIE